MLWGYYAGFEHPSLLTKLLCLQCFRVIVTDCFFTKVSVFGWFVWTFLSIGWLLLFFEQLFSVIRGTHGCVYWALESTVLLLFSLLLVKRGLSRLLYNLFLACSSPSPRPWLRRTLDLSQGLCVPRWRWYSNGKPLVSFRCIEITIAGRIWLFMRYSQDTKFVTSLTTSVLCWTFSWQSLWAAIPWCITKCALVLMVWVWSTLIWDCFFIALDSISNSKGQQLVLLTGLRPKLASNQYRASYWIVGPS